MRMQLARLGIALELLIRLIGHAIRRGDIELNDLLARRCPHVPHIDLNADLIAANTNRRVLDSKLRIPQPDPEPITRRDSGNIKVAITDIDPLAIIGIVGCAEALCTRIVRDLRPRRRQLPRGIRCAEQNVGDGIPRRTSELAHEEHRRNLRDGCEINHTANVQH